jgi:hypothetical protein
VFGLRKEEKEKEKSQGTGIIGYELFAFALKTPQRV